MRKLGALTAESTPPSRWRLSGGLRLRQMKRDKTVSANLCGPSKTPFPTETRRGREPRLPAAEAAELAELAARGRHSADGPAVWTGLRVVTR